VVVVVVLLGAVVVAVGLWRIRCVQEISSSPKAVQLVAAAVVVGLC
jgi:hypothetical protein